MANIFFDANILMRLMEGELSLDFQQKLNQYTGHLSVLSVHIAAYVHKIKLPDQRFSSLLSHFQIVPISTSTTQKSLIGPTSDYEDNIQLYSTAERGIATFITFDQDLLRLKKFHHTDIISPNSL